MLNGEQALPVRVAEAAPEIRKIFCFSREISWTVIATDDVGTSAMASTLSSSNHFRTTPEPTSGLFWWSAETISMEAPSTLPPKVLRSHLCSQYRPRPRQVLVGTGHIVEYANAHHVVRDLTVSVCSEAQYGHWYRSKPSETLQSQSSRERTACFSLARVDYTN